MALYESFNGKDDITSFLFNPDFVYYDTGVASTVDDERGTFIRTSGSLIKASKSSSMSFSSTTSNGVGMMIIPRKDGEFSSITMQVPTLPTSSVSADVYFYKKSGAMSSKTKIRVTNEYSTTHIKTLEVPDDTSIIFMRIVSVGSSWSLSLN